MQKVLYRGKQSLRLALMFITFCLIVSAGGCASEECEGNRNALPLAGFYSSSESPKSISVDSLVIVAPAAGKSQTVIDSKSAISDVYLPFNLEEDFTTFVFRYEQKALAEFNITDTITFRYQRIPFFVSSPCGAMYEFKITDIYHTGAVIDSVTCPVGTITNANAENLRIYFKVAEEGGEENE